ncbi:S24 family peptidase [Rhodopseudomonas parapalustris]
MAEAGFSRLRNVIALVTIARNLADSQENLRGGSLSFQQRLEELVETRFKGNRAEFAAPLGGKRPTEKLRQWLEGIAKPSFEALQILATAHDISLDWLLLGKQQELLRGRSHEDGTVPVELLAFKASAGGGALVVDDDSKSAPFQREALARVGVRPDNARLLYASGDSMRPTIEDGEPLLVDIIDTEIIDGRIYVFTIGDQVLVKRLRRLGSRLLMRADNRDLYPDEEEVPMIEPVRIIGRVRWVGRSL